MATPKFILDLRAKIGHDLLWLTGVSGVVVGPDQRLLLVRDAQDGRWNLPGGILEPGEQPAIGLVREVLEETAVQVGIDRLVSLESQPQTSYPNGDQAQYLDLCFRCHYLSGDARVNDDESSEVGWFPLDALPPLGPHEHTAITRALSADPLPYFETP